MAIEDRTSRSSFEAAIRKADPQREEGRSTMVDKDRPHPAPRPSPGLAQDADRAAFDATWNREVGKAGNRDRAVRMEEFKAKRTETVEISRRTFNRAAGR